MSRSGPPLWRELHTRAIAYAGDVEAERAWLTEFAKRVPCGDCRTHWRGIVADLPPDLMDADTYFAWTVKGHNAVNRRLGKAEMEVEQARASTGQTFST